MSPCEINAAITAVANALACQLSNKELAWWAVIFSQLGSAMGTIASLQEACDGDDDNIIIPGQQTG